MNVREIPGLQSIRGFVGQYAVYTAKDSEGRYFGVINRKGEIVMPMKIRRMPFFSIHDHPSIFLCYMPEGKDGMFYYDVELQKYVDRPPYEEPEKSPAQLLEENTPYGEYDNGYGGKSKFKAVYAIEDDLIKYAEEPEKWGIKDLDGNILVPAQFKHISDGGYKTYHFCVENQDGKCGVIDAHGNWIIPCVYDRLWRKGTFFIADKDRKSGIIDLAGNEIIPIVYDDLHPAEGVAMEGLDLISVKNNGEFFFINSKQERIELF